MTTKIKINSFEGQSFESEEAFLFTFKGHNDAFCINLNAECIHSVKSLSAHKKKVQELVSKFNLTEA